MKATGILMPEAVTCSRGSGDGFDRPSPPTGGVGPSPPTGGVGLS